MSRACPSYPTVCAASTSGASFTDQGGGKSSLSAPTTGAFAGFSVIADRNNTAGVAVTGNGTWSTGGGTIYTVSGKLSATSGGKAGFTRAVVDSVETSGSNSSQISGIPNTGTLSISVPVTAGLGGAAPGGTLRAALGSVTVSDGRGLASSTWTATVSATNFTTGGATSAETITTANISYWSGPATSANGTVTASPGQSPRLGQTGAQQPETGLHLHRQREQLHGLDPHRGDHDPRHRGDGHLHGHRDPLRRLTPRQGPAAVAAEADAAHIVARFPARPGGAFEKPPASRTGLFG